MKRRRLPPLFALPVVLFGFACGPHSTPTDATPDAPGSDAGSDAVLDSAPDAIALDTPSDQAPPDAGPQTYTFVLSDLTIDSDDDPRVPHTGVNLDELYSGAGDSNGCLHDDRFSMFDDDEHCSQVADGGHCALNPNPGCAMGSPGCHGGVDNQMPTMAMTLMQATQNDPRTTLTAQVHSSHLVVLVRVTGVHSLINDSNVDVYVYQGFSTFSTMCTSVLPDREYQVALASITAGGTTLDDARTHLQGTIVNGRLTADAVGSSVFDLSLPLGTNHLPLHLHRGRLRMDISATAGGRISMGGYALGNDLKDALTPMVPPAFQGFIDGAVAGLVDIQINGICDDNTVTPRRFGAIGAGFGGNAVRATIQSATPFAMSAAAGTCSAM